MHLLLIHQAFMSHDEAGGTRHLEFAQHLVRAGHRVTIVASDVSYLSGQRMAYRDGLFAEQYFDGVRVLRTYTYARLHRSFFWRVVSFLSFMVSSTWTALRVKDVDLVMGTSPPMFQAISAWAVSVLKRRPFLLEIRDLWPEFAIDIGVLRNRLLIWLSRKVEQFLYKQANHLLVNSPAYLDYLKGKMIVHDKMSLIPNGVDPEMFQPDANCESFRKKVGLEDRFLLVYAGALGLANDIPTILKAANRLRDSSDVHFLLVGDGKERKGLEEMAHQLKLQNVTFVGPIPKSQMSEVLAAADACLATLKDIPTFRTTYPNKVFDYMAAGRPTILAIDGVIRSLLEEAKGGVYVPPGNDREMAKAILGLLRNKKMAREMGCSARTYVCRCFNRKIHAADFTRLLESLLENPSIPVPSKSLYQRFGKRALDLCLALSSLFFLSPVLIVLFFLVKLKLGSQEIFLQRRPGYKGKLFMLYKFRSMTEATDSKGNLMSDAERLTSFGSFLRRTSLDELPELLNVLRGDMSLVGPRPLLVKYLDRYTPEQLRRHDVKPGITGWAQVHGRNSLTWEEKFTLDLWYVDNLSFWLDLKILFMTIWKVFKREGITQPGNATMEEFVGTSGS